MLQIRLKKDPSSEGGVGGGGGAAPGLGGGAGAGSGAVVGGLAKPSTVETVTVACPEHLVLAELPVAKGLGTAAPSSHPKIVGRKSRRQLGGRVHFCVRCDFPIAIYGRLSPCEHSFCLDCARSDSICYLCDERIQKIQTIKLMEGIFICAAPHCLKSFMKKNEFESHIHESHADLLHSKSEKEDGNESDSRNVKQSVSESTARGPPRQVFSPSSSQLHDREDKFRFHPSRDQPSFRSTFSQKSPAYSGHAHAQNIPSESLSDPQRPPGFDRPAMHGGFHSQSLDGMGSGQDSGQFPERQPGILSDLPFHGYPPMHPHQQPNYGMPGPSNPMMLPQQPYGLPSFPAEGGQPFFGSSADMVRPDSVSEAGHEPGSLLGFPPGTPGRLNFGGNYPPLWNPGMAHSPFEPQLGGGQGAGNVFGNSSDGQEKTGFYQNEYFRNPSGMVMNTPPKPMRGAGNGHLHDGKGILALQPLPIPPALQMGAHSHVAPGRFYQGDLGHDGQGFGWPHEKHDSYGSGQD